MPSAHCCNCSCWKNPPTKSAKKRQTNQARNQSQTTTRPKKPTRSWVRRKEKHRMAERTDEYLNVDRGMLDALLSGRLPDPFALLGPHRAGDGMVVRTFQPGARAVDVEAGCGAGDEEAELIESLVNVQQ